VRIGGRAKQGRAVKVWESTAPDDVELGTRNIASPLRRLVRRFSARARRTS
jgi:uncharacterized protein with von Willebrand factor type A (vWA) domain